MILGEVSSGVVTLFMCVLAVLLTRHYVRRRHLHTLWWAVSFWLAFVASVMDFGSYVMHDWLLWQYKLYLFTAAALVAYMGAGTMYLFSRKVGHVYVGLMTIIAAGMLQTLSLTPIPGLHGMPPGEKAQGFVPASIVVYFALLSGIGAVALFGGALLSFLRSRRLFNVWIALGALVFSIGGVVGEKVGIYQLFYVFQALGSVILYYGIVRSFQRPKKVDKPPLQSYTT